MITFHNQEKLANAGWFNIELAEAAPCVEVLTKEELMFCSFGISVTKHVRSGEKEISPGQSATMLCQPQVGGHLIRALCLRNDIEVRCSIHDYVVDDDRNLREIESSRREVNLPFDGSSVEPILLRISEILEVVVTNKGTTPITPGDFVAVMQIDPFVNDLKFPRFDGAIMVRRGNKWVREKNAVS